MQTIKPNVLKQAGFFYIIVAALVLYSCNSSSGNEGGYQQPIQSLPVIAVNKMTATTYQSFPHRWKVARILRSVRR